MKKNGLFFLLIFLCVSLNAAESPILKVGLISDTHVTPRLSSCQWVKKAWLLFKKKQCDLVVNLGDIADRYYPQGYRHYRNTVKEIFADGTKPPRELYVYANHDRIGVKDHNEAFAGVKKHLEVPNDPYDRVVLKGYPFLVFPQFLDMERFEKTIAETVKQFPGKPVFILDHIPPFNTIYNSKTWGDKRRLNSMNKFPQAIHISGHVHSSCFNELNIWQGNFTAVNAGCLQYWGGGLSGSSLSGSRSYEVLIMEVFKKKILFRRYSLLDGQEHCLNNVWCVPWPFDPAKAPYRSEFRKKNAHAPVFASDARITASTDKIPFNCLILSFSHASSECFSYTIRIEEKDSENKWRPLAVNEIFSSFHQLPAYRKKMITTYLSGGYFETGKTYRISAEPVNFYGQKGKALSLIWRAPAKAQGKVLFESKNPMKELPFLTELDGGEPVRRSGGFYLHGIYNARLVLPDKIWNVPQGTRLRFTADLHTIQKDKRSKQWTMVLRDPVSVSNAYPRITTHPGDSVNRYVIDFRMRKKGNKYYLLIREGDHGKLRFNYIKLESFETTNKKVRKK